jgi:nucleotide-binding universal stress UspA family protein
VRWPAQFSSDGIFKVLLPVDGSDNALRAVRHVSSRGSTCREPAEICLLNVQAPVASGVVRLFVSQLDLQAYYQEEGEKALAPAREELRRVGVQFSAEARVGDVAETIVRCTREQACGLIAMGTRGMGSVANLLLGSIASKVISLADVPVLLVK